MKKFLTTIALLILTLILLTSCGDTTNDPDTETNNNNDSEQTAAPESAFKIPEKSMRDWVVDYMYQMAEVKWSPAQDIDFTKDANGNLVGKTLYYEKGQVYHGLPYVNLLTDSDLNDFVSGLKWDEAKEMYIYEGVTDRTGDNVLGNDCSSAILLAWKRFDTNLTAYDTGHCFPLGDSTGVYALGDMVVSATDKTTDVITQNTDVQTHYAALAQLQKGDMVIWRTDAGHTRMVLEVHVEKNGTGKINGNRSYIKTIEQTNAMDSQRKDGVKTNWYVEHTYTFDVLREKFYIPVTCKALSEERVEPVIELKGGNTKKTIATVKKGSLLGTIESNYTVISATVNITAADGTTLYTETYKVPCKDLYGTSLSLKEFKFDFDLSTLESGTYTYSVSAETVCGEGEIYSVEFTK